MSTAVPEKPHPNNACSGKYNDWLEVNLLPECNARCAWCVEKKGWHPTQKASWRQIGEAAIASGKHNVILLGGEPTLYPCLKELIAMLRDAGIAVWITTNGSRLTKSFVEDVIGPVAGVNISLHSYSLSDNLAITGITLDYQALREAVAQLHEFGAKVRLNCNCIRGYIDNREEMEKYITCGAVLIGADSVRFAELKQSDDFVDLADIMGTEFGLNNDPYRCGCSIDTELCGMPVNFRLMCGLQTEHRPAPANPDQTLHGVLYYDGKIYPGWQVKEKDKMSNIPQKLTQLVLAAVADHKITPVEGEEALRWLQEKSQGSTASTGKKKKSKKGADETPASGAGCVY